MIEIHLPENQGGAQFPNFQYLNRHNSRALLNFADIWYVNGSVGSHKSRSDCKIHGWVSSQIFNR